MKKYAVIALVFTALVFASCKLEKGGTIEVINDSTFIASIDIMQGKDGIVPVVEAKRANANGGTATFSIDEDGTYTVNAVFLDQQLVPNKDHGKGEAVLSGGNKVTVHVKPTM